MYHIWLSFIYMVTNRVDELKKLNKYLTLLVNLFLQNNGLGYST